MNWPAKSYPQWTSNCNRTVRNMKKTGTRTTYSHIIKKLLLLFILGNCFWAWGQEKSSFERANAAYNEGDFETAIRLYESILESGRHSAELYYNLGNAHYKQNEIAPSIYNFEKALLLKPNDPEIKNNLGYAQKMTLDAITPLPEVGLSKFYKTFTNYLSFDQWAYAAVVLMILFTVFYIAFYYFGSAFRKRIAFIFSLTMLVFSILAVTMAYIQYKDLQANRPAIVFADEVRIQSDPNEKAQEVFVLHEGAKVSILETYNDYFKIQIADGKSGWIPKKSIKTLRDF